jgi:hypothetical protein
MCFLSGPCLDVISETKFRVLSVEAGLISSTVALRVVGGDENGIHCLGVCLGHPVSRGYK